MNAHRKLGLIVAIAGACLTAPVTTAHAAPCMLVTLTGVMGGPVLLNGVAGAGTLVRYGDDSNNCNAVSVQIDAGRGTALRISQTGVDLGALDAVFFTHMHTDHTEGMHDIMVTRWSFHWKGPKLDIVCSADRPAPPPLSHTISCKQFIAHIADSFIRSGEVAQRASEDPGRPPAGPVAVGNVITFDPQEEPKVVWSKGDVKVSAIRSNHMPGHASYRVDTPAGSVVVGGDAANDAPASQRATSTSAQVERLAKGVDVIVHSNIHPVMAPGGGSTMPARTFERQSSTSDLGAMAQRAGAKHLMLSHMAPQPGQPVHGPWKVPGGGVSEAAYRKVVEDAGFRGNIIVGTDLATVRLPAR